MFHRSIQFTLALALDWITPSLKEVAIQSSCMGIRILKPIVGLV